MFFVLALNNMSERWRKREKRGREERKRKERRDKYRSGRNKCKINVNGLRGICVHVNIFVSKQTPAVETCHCTYSKEMAYCNTPSASKSWYSEEHCIFKLPTYSTPHKSKSDIWLNVPMF